MPLLLCWGFALMYRKIVESDPALSILDSLKLLGLRNRSYLFLNLVFSVPGCFYDLPEIDKLIELYSSIVIIVYRIEELGRLEFAKVL